MKKILFKAKRIDNKEWIEGIPFYVAEKWVMLINHDENAVRPPYVAGSMCEAEIYCREIDPETICQYTGLIDQNGKQIFEGDILMCHNNKNDLVKAVFGPFAVIDVETLEKVDEVIGWHYEVIATDEISRCEPFNIDMPLVDAYIKICEMEVIENIFDNPEFLKEMIKE